MASSSAEASSYAQGFGVTSLRQGFGLAGETGEGNQNVKGFAHVPRRIEESRFCAGYRLIVLSYWEEGDL
jgi:hypothetical protein